jgi:hypothetical protein
MSYSSLTSYRVIKPAPKKQGRMFHIELGQNVNPISIPD